MVFGAEPWGLRGIGPTGRPLAEPPILNYDRFVRFAGINSLRRSIEATLGERPCHGLLLERRHQGTTSPGYYVWTYSMIRAESGVKRKEFYEGLLQEISEDENHPGRHSRSPDAFLGQVRVTEVIVSLLTRSTCTRMMTAAPQRFGNILSKRMIFRD